MPKPLGSINAYVNSLVIVGRKHCHFDGTTLNLVKVAIANGAKVGDTVRANYGGLSPQNATYHMFIIAAPHDQRAGGYWAVDKDGMN